MPHALELPRVRRAVVPLMRAGDTVVDELVADRFPGPAAVAAPLHRLPEPVARLRGVDAVGIDRRSLEVVELPAAELWRADLPVPPRAVRGEDERAFARPDENANSAHGCSGRLAYHRRRRGRRRGYLLASNSAGGSTLA